MNVATKVKRFKLGLTSATVLTIELSEGSDSTYHGLD